MERDTDGMKTSTRGSLKWKLKFYTCLQRICKVTMILALLSLVLIYSEIGYSFHEKQITRPAELPRRFFPSHSGVVDQPYGDLGPVIRLLQEEELIFVMYYAPWCSESMVVRGEFIRAARVLSDTVKFVGVNCWYYEGECRQRMKFLSYPEMFVYLAGVQMGYRFSGVREAEYFVKFAESFLYPLKSLYSENDMGEFLAQQENTVVGYFDFHASPQPPGPKFHQFFLSSLRTLSYDFHQPVRYAVVRNRRLAMMLDMLDSESTFALFRVGNSTLRYPYSHNFTCSNITSWIQANRVKRISPWLVPPGIKSLTLSMPMQRGPAVLVFAPVNPLLEFNPYLDMVRMAALEYGNCGNLTKARRHYVQNLVISSILSLQLARNLQNQSLENTKTVTKKSLPPKDTSSNKCCMSLSQGCCPETQNCVCEYCVHRENKRKGARCRFDVNKGLLDDLHVHSCSDFAQFYNINEHHSLCCKDKNSITPTTLYPQDSVKRTRRVTDPYVANAENNYLKRRLRKLTLQKMKRLITIEDLSKHVTTISDIKEAVNFTGLQCRTNRTVQFYFVDSVHHSLFVEHLGVPTAVEPKQPSVILMDLKAESQYILREQLTYENLAHFVMNYSSSELVQHRRSTEVSTPSPCGDRDVICLAEVTAHTFQSIVMDPSRDVLLFYYAPWCGFCNQLTQVILSVAQYFSDMDSITFARINGDTNDLPWHYTVDSYPTLLFFPATRKSESVAFPENVPKTLPNLIKFISYHANKTVQLNTAINMCTSECKAKNLLRVKKRLAELDAGIAQLKRREVTLWSQLPSNEEHQKLLQTESLAARKAQKELRDKQTTAQMLIYFLQEQDWKMLSRASLLSFLTSLSQT